MWPKKSCTIIIQTFLLLTSLKMLHKTRTHNNVTRLFRYHGSQDPPTRSHTGTEISTQGRRIQFFSCINTTSIYRSYKCIINPRICKPPIHIFSVSTQVLSPNSFSTINIACTQTTWQQVYLNGVMVKWCNGEMSHTW